VIYKDVELEDASGDVCALHVTFPGLKYNGNRELQNYESLPTNCYAVP
jgi:hypothetical protein